MRVSVDETRCQGHARCNLLAPEVFDLDDEGFAVVLDPDVAPEHEGATHDAASNCPERAIIVD